MTELWPTFFVSKSQGRFAKYLSWSGKRKNPPKGNGEKARKKFARFTGVMMKNF